MDSTVEDHSSQLIGREPGLEGLRAYVEAKALYRPVPA